MASLLARPVWRVGQVLLPEHFLALEQALSAEGALRAQLSGPPAHGVARLEWNGDDPKNGSLWVEGLTAVLPSGRLVDVPGNAGIRGPIDLKEVGRSEVEVYAHLLEAAPEEQEIALDPPSPRDIPRRRDVVVLTAERSLDGSLGRIALGVFVQGARGAFRLSDKIVPPLLRLDTTPYLGGRLNRLRGELAVLEQTFDELAVDALARGESLGPLQRARLETRKVAALLDDVAQGVPLHPYLVFSALRAYSLDLYLLDERAAPWQPPAYDHDAPGGCFSAVFAEISARVQVPAPSSPVVSFLPDNGRLVAADLPAELLSAPEVYVAVLKARSADSVPFDGVRFASPGRLRVVREHALRGVRLTPVPSPTFRHGFRGAVEFYRVSTGEEGEWGHVTRERALAFLPPAQMEGQKAVLCWRRP